MFKVIDMNGIIHDVYGTYLDADEDVQFILCNNDGEFYITEHVKGFFKLYKEENNEELIDKIANHLEKNWGRLKECWLSNGISDDLRNLLKEALK